MTHKYQTGQTVHFTPQWRRGGASGTYKIVRPLPIENDGRVLYRIKSTAESHERVADEIQLTRAG